MKKISFLFITALFFIFFSCQEHFYSYAKISVVNNWNSEIKYKAGFLNEIYNDNTSDKSRNKSINIIYPNLSALKPTNSDTVELNWGISQNFVLAKVFWGNNSVYDRSTDFFRIYDGQNLIVDLSVDISVNPKGYTIR